MEPFSSFREILERLLSSPCSGQVKIVLDKEKKNISFSLPIFTAPTALPEAVQRYVKRREKKVFLPHATQFVFHGEKEVLLVQERSLVRQGTSCFREELLQFYQLAKRCHALLLELAVEEASLSALT